MPYTGPGARFSVTGLAEKAYENDQRSGRHQWSQDQPDQRRRRLHAVADRERDAQADRGGARRLHFRFDRDDHPALGREISQRAKNPQLFIESGAYRWGRYKDTPYTIGGVRPSYRLGARLYVRHSFKQDPNAKICILYEDNDYGRDYTAGARDVLGDKYAATVKEATYESRMPRSTGRSSNSRPPAAMR